MRVRAGRIPSNAKVHAYPLHKKYALVCIWMGNPALADATEIFEIESFHNPDWGINRGATIELALNCQLMWDNHLDPTNVAWVHASGLGQSATRDALLRVSKSD